MSITPVVRSSDVRIAEHCVKAINAYWAERGLDAGATLGKRAAIQSNLNTLGFHLPTPTAKAVNATPTAKAVNATPTAKAVNATPTAKALAPSARRQRASKARETSRRT